MNDKAFLSHIQHSLSMLIRFIDSKSKEYGALVELINEMRARENIELDEQGR